MTARFNKAALVGDLTQRAKILQELNEFDTGNGTAQLRTGACDAATTAIIERAVRYGRWRAMLDIADQVEFGGIGRAKQE